MKPFCVECPSDLRLDGGSNGKMFGKAGLFFLYKINCPLTFAIEPKKDNLSSAGCLVIEKSVMQTQKFSFKSSK